MQSVTRSVTGFALCMVIVVCLPSRGMSQGQGDQPSGAAIKPPHVYAITMSLRHDLELIRVELDAAQELRPEIDVRHARPREVFFQAQTLYRKAAWLCRQFTGQRYRVPPAPEVTIAPMHVFGVVRDALEKLACVKNALQITEPTREVSVDNTKTPTDVFKSIVQASRQLNATLEHPFTPRDVFARVQLASEYAVSFLRHFGQDARMPAEPPYESGKRPVHVYTRLVEILGTIRTIAQPAGLQVPELHADIHDAIVPSDVYDIASLIVSEMRYFNTFVKVEVEHQPVSPRRKVPSHVFQKAGLLEAQIEELQRLTRQFPHWKTRGHAAGH